MPQSGDNVFENNSISNVYGNTFASNTTADVNRLTVNYPTVGSGSVGITTTPFQQAWSVWTGTGMQEVAPVEEGPLAWLRRRISEVTENVPW